MPGVASWCRHSTLKHIGVGCQQQAPKRRNPRHFLLLDVGPAAGGMRGGIPSLGRLRCRRPEVILNDRAFASAPSLPAFLKDATLVRHRFRTARSERDASCRHSGRRGDVSWRRGRAHQLLRTPGVELVRPRLAVRDVHAVSSCGQRRNLRHSFGAVPSVSGTNRVVGSCCRAGGRRGWLTGRFAERPVRSVSTAPTRSPTGAACAPESGRRRPAAAS